MGSSEDFSAPSSQLSFEVQIQATPTCVAPATISIHFKRDLLTLLELSFSNLQYLPKSKVFVSQFHICFIMYGFPAFLF